MSQIKNSIELYRIQISYTNEFNFLIKFYYMIVQLGPVTWGFSATSAVGIVGIVGLMMTAVGFILFVRVWERI